MNHCAANSDMRKVKSPPRTRLLSRRSGWSIDAKNHDLSDFARWPSELHQGVEGPQGLPQGGTLEQIFVF